VKARTRCRILDGGDDAQPAATAGPGEGLQSNPELFESTSLFVTFDEVGGYRDSGFIQPIDFFGDGPRIH
jgi:hypothetical protein